MPRWTWHATTVIQSTPFGKHFLHSRFHQQLQNKQFLDNFWCHCEVFPLTSTQKMQVFPYVSFNGTLKAINSCQGLFLVSLIYTLRTEKVSKFPNFAQLVCWTQKKQSFPKSAQELACKTRWGWDTHWLQKYIQNVLAFFLQEQSEPDSWTKSILEQQRLPSRARGSGMKAITAKLQVHACHQHPYMLACFQTVVG